MILLAALLALLPSVNAQTNGFPACAAPTQELVNRSSFTLCFDSSHKVPTWTAHQLTPQHPASATSHPKHFRHDYHLASLSAFNSDYRKSGYSRGHLVPLADLSDEAAIQDSFLLSNAIPQNQTANQSAWKRIENAVRALATTNQTVTVITGTLFDCPETPRIGAHQIAVPCATFKAVLAENGNRKVMYAAIVPNNSTATLPISNYTVSTDELERRSGLDFWPGLDKSEQSKLESETHPFPHR